jgi:hypothetical protein
VPEDTSLWVGWLSLLDRGQGGAAPCSNAILVVQTVISLTSCLAGRRCGLAFQVEEGPT